MTDKEEILKEMRDSICSVDNEMILEAYAIAIKQLTRSRQRIDSIPCSKLT